MRKHAKLKAKQKWSNEKLHLENARKLRGIYFIDPEDKEFITALQFGSQTCSDASSYENFCSKSSGGQGMGKLEKISAWNLTKVRNKSEVIDEARTSGAKAHFASILYICHLKNVELEAKHQKYKGRVVLRGVIVKDDSGSYAVFTEQGSSASQMTAAKIMDHLQIARLRWTNSRRSISLYPSENGRCSQIIEIPKSECPEI